MSNVYYKMKGSKYLLLAVDKCCDELPLLDLDVNGDVVATTYEGEFLNVLRYCPFCGDRVYTVKWTGPVNDGTSEIRHPGDDDAFTTALVIAVEKYGYDEYFDSDASAIVDYICGCLDVLKSYNLDTEDSNY